MSLIKFIVAGDFHGNEAHARSVVNHAVEHGAEYIFQVGDFGLWPGIEGMKYLDNLNAALQESNRFVVWTDGNHEDHDQLERIVKYNPRTKHGLVYTRSNILYAPRGHAWTWGGKRFMAIGGAVSIDKKYRLSYEQSNGKKIWWPGEQLTEAQANGIIADVNARRQRGRQGVDYLFTHDCSDRTPFRERLKPDPESQTHRQRLDRVLRAVQPRFHWHGHMHTRYDWMNPVGEDASEPTGLRWAQTYGLDCDGARDSWGVFDTDDERFAFDTDL